ncbi:PH domain-containing protein [Clostridium sp.]|uniref:PH domain-containing protein n=1 Tax=Clostridium sp. TaxID=1506 RepID=UPI003464E53D
MEQNKLNVNSKKSWFIARLIATVIISTILIGGKILFLNKVLEDNINPYINITIVVIIGIMILNTIIYPAIEYKQWYYTITKDKVEFSEGIFFRERTIIPIVRIQHIKINEGPINRFLNLANIKIHTAGGVHKIPNIDREKAEEISHYLKDKVKEKVNLNAEGEK